MAVDPAAVADAFAVPIEAAARRGDDVETLLWAGWDRLIRAADTPDDRDRQALVEAVLLIRDRVATGPDGAVCRVWDDRVVFTDLPILGPRMRETWNESGSPEFWGHLNAFAARLTVAGVDFALYGVWAMRWALEESAPEMPLTAVTSWLAYGEGTLTSPHRPLPDVAPGDLARAAGITDAAVTPRRRAFWQERLAQLR